MGRFVGGIGRGSARSGTRGAGGWRALLANRLLLALLAVSLIPLALMGIATYRAASASLTREAFAKLAANEPG